MEFPLDVVIIATAVALGAGVAFTVWTFKPKKGHDHETTELLKRFFDGKACAICKRPIPPVYLTGGLKPGLLNQTTRETLSWDEIPNTNVATALEGQLPLCSACEVAESFRHRFADRIVDGDATHPHDQSGAASSADAVPNASRPVS